MRKTKHKKTWRYYVGYWGPIVVVALIVFLAMLSLTTPKKKEVPAEEEHPYYSFTVTPNPVFLNGVDTNDDF